MDILLLQPDVEFGLHPSSLEDVGCEVRSIRIIQSVRTAAVPITPDQPVEEYRKVAVSHMVEIEFRNVVSVKLQQLAWSALANDSTTTGGRRPGEMYFTAVMYPGAVGSSNPKYGGWVIPVNVTVGGPVGRLDEQTQRWQARGITIL